MFQNFIKPASGIWIINLILSEHFFIVKIIQISEIEFHIIAPPSLLINFRSEFSTFLINLFFKSGDQEWGFTVKGESLNLSSLKIPVTGPADTAEEIENTVIEKIYLYDQAIQFIENLFINFIKKRTSNHWQNKVIPMIRNWICT